MNEFFLFQKRGKLGQMKRFTRDLNARALCPSRAIVLLSFVFCVFFPQFSKFVERFFLSFSSRDSFFYLLVVCGSLSDGGHNSQMLRQQPPPLLYWNSKQVEWLFFLLLQFFFEFLFFFFVRGLGSCWCAFRPTRFFLFPATYQKKNIFSLFCFIFSFKIRIVNWESSS